MVFWVSAGSCKKAGVKRVGKEVLSAVAILFTMVDGAADACIYHTSLRHTERLLKLQEV
jgi:hypothetical protein